MDTTKPGDVQANQWPGGGVKISPTVTGTCFFFLKKKAASPTQSGDGGSVLGPPRRRGPSTATVRRGTEIRGDRALTPTGLTSSKWLGGDGG